MCVPIRLQSWGFGRSRRHERRDLLSCLLILRRSDPDLFQQQSSLIVELDLVLAGQQDRLDTAAAELLAGKIAVAQQDVRTIGPVAPNSANVSASRWLSKSGLASASMMFYPRCQITNRQRRRLPIEPRQGVINTLHFAHSTREATRPGLEPGTRVPKTLVLPLHHRVVVRNPPKAGAKCDQPCSGQISCNPILFPNGVSSKGTCGS